MPACFYEAVGFCCRRQHQEIRFEKFWWGHRFLDQSAADAGSLVDLTSIVDPFSPYSDLGSSENYQAMNRSIALNITVTRFSAVESYVDALCDRLRAGTLCVIPFPLCRVTGLRAMELPTEHFVVAWDLLSNRISVLDQHNRESVAIEDFADRMAWLYARYKYIPLYDISADQSALSRLTHDEVAGHRLDAALYEERGRAILSKYQNDADTLAGLGSEANLPSGNIWRISQCRWAELQYIQASSSSALKSLYPAADLLFKLWLKASTCVKYNGMLPADQFVGLSTILPEIIQAEESYFTQLRRI